VTGLSFDLTEEQEQLRQTVRDFADRECPKDVAAVTQAPRLSRPAAQAESA
jgi:alkylation response protein AidB-like acyl-CoA dehydrogenase